VRAHELKTWPYHFGAVACGNKRFEMRYNDRDFKVGDILWLREWEPHLDYKATKQGHYTGREVKAEVTYVLQDTEEQPEFCPDGWVIMSISLLGGDN
jgi:hypothetical protein